jgi:hypothetical protein
MTDQDLEMVKTRRELFARAETKTRFGQRGEAFDDVSSAIASYRHVCLCGHETAWRGALVGHIIAAGAEHGIDVQANRAALQVIYGNKWSK